MAEFEWKSGPWYTTPHLWEKLKPLARQNRHQATPAEQRLWTHLRDRRLDGVKFRRQFPIERFIVDFITLKPRLVIEVDGAVHDYMGEEDVIRQEFIESLGLRVIRFKNEDIFQNLEGVLVWISKNLCNTVPPPQSGEGDRG